MFIPVSIKTTRNTAKERSPAPTATYTKVPSQNPPIGDIHGAMVKCGQDLGSTTNMLVKAETKFKEIRESITRIE
jgi:hypothetical protein